MVSLIIWLAWRLSGFATVRLLFPPFLYCPPWKEVTGQLTQQVFVEWMNKFKKYLLSGLVYNTRRVWWVGVPGRVVPRSLTISQVPVCLTGWRLWRRTGHCADPQKKWHHHVELCHMLAEGKGPVKFGGPAASSRGLQASPVKWISGVQRLPLALQAQKQCEVTKPGTGWITGHNSYVIIFSWRCAWPKGHSVWRSS